MTNFSSTPAVLSGFQTNQRSLLEGLPIYQREPSVVGTDLVIEPQQDIVLKRNGDIDTITGAKSIIQNLLRRMTTPPDGYARWVRTGDGVEILDEEYGNDAYSYLSTPLSTSDPESIKAAAFAAAEQEPRIRLLDVVVNSDILRGIVDIKLDYRILPNSELQTINTTLLSRLVQQ